VDDLVAVYRELGGQAFDSVVYRRMKQLRQGDGRSWPPNAHSAIRQTRQSALQVIAYAADGRDLITIENEQAKQEALTVIKDPRCEEEWRPSRLCAIMVERPAKQSPSERTYSLLGG
jgi:hypothetical protein